MCAKVSKKDGDEAAWESLILAAEKGNTEEVERLIKIKGIPINKGNDDGFTALALAAQEGHTKIVKALLKFCDRETLWFRQQKPLHLASQNGHLEVVEALFEFPYLVCRHYYDELLHQWSSYGDQLVDESDSDRLTPLHLAAKNGHLEVVKLLLKNSAPTYLSDRNGNFPIHLAAEGGHEKVVETLIFKKCLDFIEDLSDCQNSTNDARMTPLHIAAEKGFDKVVEVLLRHKSVQVNINGPECSRPIHLAAKNGHDKVLELFLANAKQENSKNESGKTALDLAKEGNHSPCVKMLEERFQTDFDNFMLDVARLSGDLI